MIAKVRNALYSYQILKHGDASVYEENKHLQRTEQRVGIKWAEKLILCSIKMYLVFIFLTVDNWLPSICLECICILFGYKILNLENTILKHNSLNDLPLWYNYLNKSVVVYRIPIMSIYPYLWRAVIVFKSKVYTIQLSVCIITNTLLWLLSHFTRIMK